MSNIEFAASVWKVATLVDGGIRITLDAAGSDANMIAMTELAACQIHGVALDITAVPLKNSKDQYNAVSKRSKWESQRTTS